MVADAEVVVQRGGVALGFDADQHHQQSSDQRKRQRGVNYQWTPKVSVGASVSTSYSFGALTPEETGQAFGYFASAQRGYSAAAHLAYAITPFLAANLSYSYYRTLQLYATTNTSMILLAFNFNPH